jgi:DNA polymerase III epsilon subunit-like protein
MAPAELGGAQTPGSAGGGVNTVTEKFLFFDTETTGKADFHAPPSAPQQPRLVQLAALLVEAGAGDGGVAATREVAALNVMIRPAGFGIPLAASAIHGITTAQAARCGVDLLSALALFGELARAADFLVAHNIQFDRLVMESEFHRTGGLLPERRERCTMKAMTPVCALPGQHGSYKWPKLQEAYQHCFQRKFAGAHGALADARACAEVFFWLRQREAALEAARPEGNAV